MIYSLNFVEFKLAEKNPNQMTKEKPGELMDEKENIYNPTNRTDLNTSTEIDLKKRKCDKNKITKNFDDLEIEDLHLKDTTEFSELENSLIG